MGKRGPKPTPTSLKLLKGEKKSRINMNEPKPQPVAPGREKFIKGEARRMHDKLAPELEEIRVLKITDGPGWAVTCWIWGQWIHYVRRTEKLRKQGKDLYETKAGVLREHPDVSAGRETLKLLKQYLVEFGLTPSSRQGISVSLPSIKNSKLLDLID
jgi:P27 family predicted phage terminase small subunit